jgi:excisionase family DNA binding protein
MSEQTIGAVVKLTGISRSTLFHAAKEGRIPARQSGRYWLVDVEHDDFKKWIKTYESHPRVKGKKKHE